MDNAAKPSPCFSQHFKVSILEGSRQPHFASPTTLSFATTECERIINPDKEGYKKYSCRYIFDISRVQCYRAADEKCSQSSGR